MDTIEFSSLKAPYGCLSNFSAHDVVCRGTTWRTVEHWFQGQKFADYQLRFAIQMAKTPSEAKKLGRSREHPLRSDWEEVKLGIMREGLLAKAKQHGPVREVLLGTGDAVIVERSKKDAFWGNGGDGSGLNHLGRLWMDVRSELTKNGPYDELADAPPPPWIACPDIPYGSIGWRMGGGEGVMIEFSNFWRGVSSAGRATYRERHPAPKGWERFYSR